MADSTFADEFLAAVGGRPNFADTVMQGLADRPTLVQTNSAINTAVTAAVATALDTAAADAATKASAAQAAAISAASTDAQTKASAAQSAATTAAATDATNKSNAVRSLTAFCSGKPLASEVIGAGIAPWAITVTAGNSKAYSQVAATASTVFTIKRGTTTLGTVTFAAGSTTGTVAVSSGAITANQVITITAPATPDATLADISFMLKA